MKNVRKTFDNFRTNLHTLRTFLRNIRENFHHISARLRQDFTKMPKTVSNLPQKTRNFLHFYAVFMNFPQYFEKIYELFYEIVRKIPEIVQRLTTKTKDPRAELSYFSTGVLFFLMCFVGWGFLATVVFRKQTKRGTKNTTQRIIFEQTNSRCISKRQQHTPLTTAGKSRPDV